MVQQCLVEGVAVLRGFGLEPRCGNGVHSLRRAGPKTCEVVDVEQGRRVSRSKSKANASQM